MPRKTRISRKPVQIGLLGTISIIAALMIFMYASTFEPETMNILLAGTLLGLSGLVLAVTFQNVQFTGFDFTFVLRGLIWTVAAVALIWIVNQSVPFTLGVTVLSLKWFAVLMGVMEELFFRLFLCNFIKKTTGSSLFAIGISAFIWGVYHIARYGGAFHTYWVIFLAGLGLGAVMLQSRQGDTVIFAHALVNYLAVA